MDSNKYDRLLQVEQEWLKGASVSIPQGLFSRKIISSADDAALARLRDLLRTVDNFKKIDWDDLQKLVGSLPSWFIGACSAPLAADEENIWLSRWRQLSGEERLKFEEERGWSAIDWLYWLHPDQRTWFIASSEKYQDRSQHLKIITLEWLVPLGALIWALRCAGAFMVEVRDVDEA